MAQTAGEHPTWKTARLDWLERLLCARVEWRGGRAARAKFVWRRARGGSTSSAARSPMRAGDKLADKRRRRTKVQSVDGCSESAHVES